MLEDYRQWLRSELALLSNASHHAYAFGQANMAKRALEELDAILGPAVVVTLSREDASASIAALDALVDAAPVLGALRAALAAAV